MEYKSNSLSIFAGNGFSEILTHCTRIALKNSCTIKPKTTIAKILNFYFTQDFFTFLRFSFAFGFLSNFWDIVIHSCILGTGQRFLRLNPAVCPRNVLEDYGKVLTFTGAWNLLVP